MAFDPDLCNLYAFAKEGCDDETEHAFMNEHAKRVKTKMGLDDNGGKENMNIGDFDIMELLFGSDGMTATVGGVSGAYLEDKIIETLEPRLGETMGEYAGAASLILAGVGARLVTKKMSGSVKDVANGFAFVTTCSGYSDILKNVRLETNGETV